MSNNPNAQFRELLWALIQKHYQVDRNDPNLLISKNPGTGNSINQIADELLSIVMQHLETTQASNKQTTQEEIDSYTEQYESWYYPTDGDYYD